MEWDYSKWKPRTKIIWMIIVGIASFIFFANRGHAEETIGEHIQEAAFDVMAATVSFAGAAQCAASGNFVTGTMLMALGGRELGEAYKEIKCAWQIYNNTYDDPNRNDRDISPAESMIEHGRD